MNCIVIGLLIANLVLSIVNNLKLKKMAEDVNQKFHAVMDQIDTETNRIASEVESLKGVIKNAGMSTAQESDILARLESIKSKLEPIGKPEDTTGGTGTGEEGDGGELGGEGGLGAEGTTGPNPQLTN